MSAANVQLHCTLYAYDTPVEKQNVSSPLAAGPLWHSEGVSALLGRQSFSLHQRRDVSITIGICLASQTRACFSIAHTQCASACQSACSSCIGM